MIINKWKRFGCWIFGHSWYPSQYYGCHDTHEDCFSCGDFRIKPTFGDIQ